MGSSPETRTIKLLFDNSNTGVTAAQIDIKRHNVIWLNEHIPNSQSLE